MKKKCIFFVFTTLVLTTFANAQQSETVVAANEQELKPQRKIFKPRNPSADKTDVVEITGIGGATFTASNSADGSEKGYDHTLEIVLKLQTSNNKAGNFQLVFYGDNDRQPYAAAEQAGIMSIYFPISTYDGIRQRLEQSFVTRKKVQIKVVQTKEGYREGALIF